MKQLKKITKIAKDIEVIKIQWATNIAREWMRNLWEEISSQKFKDLSEFGLFLNEAIKLLKNARETEPMLFNWLNLCLKNYKELSKQKETLAGMQKKLSKVCLWYVAEIEKEEKIRPIIWAKLIKSGYNIFTHCHSGSVVKLLTTAWNQWKKIQVYNSETRPLYQWRKTSQDLVNAGVPDTMVTDNIAPFFVDNLYESDVNIDMVVLGCDAIKIDGSIYNKVGSFGIAMAARHSGIPVYIVWSLTKVDTENTVEIEIRDWKEIRDKAPKWLKFLNYAFDMVPAKFITGIITEYGVIKPKDLKKYMKIIY